MRFHGQLVATETEANAPNGSLLQTLRSPLSLNTWRVYDPRVGQYLTPEPMATEGATRWSSYGYALEAPFDLWDPDRRFISSCTATPGAAAICGAGIVGGGALFTAQAGTTSQAGGALLDPSRAGSVTPASVVGTVDSAIDSAICVMAANVWDDSSDDTRVDPIPGEPHPCTPHFEKCEEWCDQQHRGAANLCCRAWCDDATITCHHGRPPPFFDCGGALPPQWWFFI